MDHKTGCLVCGGDLVYSDSDSPAECYYCGEKRNANARCINGHYICDACHQGSANDLIERYCINTNETNPVKIAISLMSSPKIKMHGPEHHFLVPAALLAAYGNSGFISPEEKKDKIVKARKRAEIVPGGFCGFYGTCGAGIGTGIFISLVTNATPYSKTEWKISNLMTSKSLKSIAEHGGPRCCKRDSFLAILDAVEFTRAQFGSNWNADERVVCTFSSMNAECLKMACKFYNAYSKS